MKPLLTGLLGASALLMTLFLLSQDSPMDSEVNASDDGGAQTGRRDPDLQQPPGVFPEEVLGLAPGSLSGVQSGPATGPPSPGNDLTLGGSWEPTIAVDPNDQDTIAAAQGSAIWISFDGGETFPGGSALTAPTPQGITLGGDASLAFNSRGSLFITYLGSPTGPGRDVYIAGWTRIGNAFNLTVGPINVTASAGIGAPNNADKEWLAADWFSGSPFQDALHVTWSDLDQSPWRVYSTTSTDFGFTWSPAALLSGPADGPKPWGVHNTVGPDGDVFVTYHAQTGFLDPTSGNRVPDGISGGVVMHRSTDGGLSYLQTANDPFKPGFADVTWNVQNKVNGVVPGNSSWWQGNAQAPVLADPNKQGRIFVVATDDPDNNVDFADAADIFIVRSDDSGATWGPRVRVDDAPPGAFSILPAAAIDPISSAIVVTWYDNRTMTTGTSGEWLLDLRLRSSSSGGLTFGYSTDVNDGQFDPGLSGSCRFCCNVGDCTAGSPRTRRIGEYNGVAMGECTAHIVWADNETTGAGGSNLDIFYDKDPEAGGDLTPPVVVCPPNVSLACDDSIDPSFTGFATTSDNCDLNPSLSYVDIVTPGNCPPSTVLKTIERVWNSTDAAGNLKNCSQIITIVDFDAPTIFNLPPPLVIETSAGCVLATDPQVVAWLAPIIALDDCSGTDLNIILPDLFLGACGAGLEHNITVAAADECGNGTFALVQLTVIIKPGRGTPFCFGTENACPCGNAGLPGHGCEIAQGTGGVCLNDVNFNSDGAGGGSVDLMGVGFPLGTSYTVVAVRSPNAVPALPLGDGTLCLGGPIKRLATKSASDGKVLFHLNHDAGAGQFHYQLWFRNPPIQFCNAQAAFNLSNGLSLDWQ